MQIDKHNEQTLAIRHAAIDPAQIRIRRMTSEDIEQVLKVERASFSQPWSADAYSATLLLPYAHYYVAELLTDDAGARIIGECGVRDIFGEGEITNVAVLPSFRGAGVAGRMLGTLLEESLEKGMQAFTLEVRAGNRPAIALYEKFGFQTEGVREGFYEEPVEDALIMWRRNAQ
jgi:ribosomal-protein-alanine N-acetyltransferase